LAREIRVNVIEIRPSVSPQIETNALRVVSVLYVVSAYNLDQMILHPESILPRKEHRRETLTELFPSVLKVGLPELELGAAAVVVPGIPILFELQEGFGARKRFGENSELDDSERVVGVEVVVPREGAVLLANVEQNLIAALDGRLGVHRARS
jgi:hypothetical protein